MKKKEGELKQKLSSIEKLRKILICEFGKSEFENIVEDISNIIKNKNLDITPTILEDLLEYINLVMQAQEQPVVYINLDENFTQEVIEKISQLNKLLNQKPKITTCQNF